MERRATESASLVALAPPGLRYPIEIVEVVEVVHGHSSFFQWNDEFTKCRLLVPAFYLYRLTRGGFIRALDQEKGDEEDSRRLLRSRPALGRRWPTRAALSAAPAYRSKLRTEISQ